MPPITSAELQKKFGLYREKALKEPVSVTHHGRKSLVLLAADEYKRLKALDTRQPRRPGTAGNAGKSRVPAPTRREPAQTPRG